MDYEKPYLREGGMKPLGHYAPPQQRGYSPMPQSNIFNNGAPNYNPVPGQGEPFDQRGYQKAKQEVAQENYKSNLMRQQYLNNLKSFEKEQEKQRLAQIEEELRQEKQMQLSQKQKMREFQKQALDQAIELKRLKHQQQKQVDAFQQYQLHARESPQRRNAHKTSDPIEELIRKRTIDHEAKTREEEASKEQLIKFQKAEAQKQMRQELEKQIMFKQQQRQREVEENKFQHEMAQKAAQEEQYIKQLEKSKRSADRDQLKQYYEWQLAHSKKPENNKEFEKDAYVFFEGELQERKAEVRHDPILNPVGSVPSRESTRSGKGRGYYSPLLQAANSIFC